MSSDEALGSGGGPASGAGGARSPGEGPPSPAERAEGRGVPLLAPQPGIVLSLSPAMPRPVPGLLLSPSCRRGVRAGRSRRRGPAPAQRHFPSGPTCRGGSWPPVPQLPGPVREPASPEASPAAGLRSLGPARGPRRHLPVGGHSLPLGASRLPNADSPLPLGPQEVAFNRKMVSQDRRLAFSPPPALLGCVVVGRASSLGEPCPQGRNEGQRGRGRPGAPRLAVG